MLDDRIVLTVATPAGPLRIGSVGASAVRDWCRRLASAGNITATPFAYITRP